MCFKCVLRAVLAEAAEAEAQAGAPGQTEGPSVPDYDQEHTKAQINSMQANSVHTLVEAADVLGSMGKDELADRVLLVLDRLLPQREERRASTEKVAAVDPREIAIGRADQSASVITPANPVDEFEGLPSFLKDHILAMREQGVEIEVVRLPL
ncbi:hypothetical protein D3C86_984910 [compost metagenome]